ncbi:hypothetical protein IWZ01DRAFT_258740 [Phyllosticta capitalensis]
MSRLKMQSVFTLTPSHIPNASHSHMARNRRHYPHGERSFESLSRSMAAIQPKSRSASRRASNAYCMSLQGGSPWLYRRFPWRSRHAVRWHFPISPQAAQMGDNAKYPDARRTRKRTNSQVELPPTDTGRWHSVGSRYKGDNVGAVPAAAMPMIPTVAALAAAESSLFCARSQADRQRQSLRAMMHQRWARTETLAHMLRPTTSSCTTPLPAPKASSDSKAGLQRPPCQAWCFSLRHSIVQRSLEGARVSCSTAIVGLDWITNLLTGPVS